MRRDISKRWDNFRYAMSVVTRMFGVVATTAVLAGCSEGVLAAHGTIARQERQLLFEALACMLTVVIPVIALTLFFAWWYRASNCKATYRPTWNYSGRIEFSIWAIPLLVVLFLSCLAWSGSHELDPYKSIKSDQKPLTIEVVSLDWKWLFIYPEQGIATVNELALPVGRPVEFKLTSGTVMNSFYVPGIAGQIYTMAGMQTHLSVIASDEGTYRGMSAQFSGDGFSDMRFKVLAMNNAHFSSWVDQARAKAIGGMSNDVFDTLAATHKTQLTTFYSSVDGDVFAHALMPHGDASSAAPMPGMTMSMSPSNSKAGL